MPSDGTGLTADQRPELTADQRRELTRLLERWLPGQRWFAGKGRRVDALTLCAASTLPGTPAVSHLVVGVRLDGEHWHAYQVPVVLHPAPNPDVPLIGRLSGDLWAHDALLDPAAIPALLRASPATAQVDPARTHGAGASGWEPLLQAVVDPVALTHLPARPLGVEQSNTSVVLGETALVKFFRLLTPGVNPDVEVHACLGEAGCKHVGRSLGWVNAGWHDPDDGQWVTGHSAMVQELLVPAVEGWQLAVRRLADGQPFSEEARALGRATAQVHHDLRRVLPTHVLAPSEVQDLVERLHGRLDRAVAAVPELGPLARALHRRIDGLRDLGHPLEVQRIHGDLHLQQVMRAADGWKLLDFEGEPGTPVAQRSAPDHPLRDVAGMLRSFAYVAAAAGGGRDADEVARWRSDCEQGFLSGYAGAAAADEGAREDGVEQRILSAYLVDKAAYEAVYERRFRPDWLPIPLTALAHLADPGG